MNDHWTIVSADDWQMLYDANGQKVMEGHSLDLRDVLDLVGVRCEFFEDDETDEFGACAAYSNLSEYPEGTLR
jgi:hypothetical protein